MPNKLAYFEFYPDNPKREWSGQHFYLRILFGEGKIDMKGGGGVWEDVKRPYLQPLTVWRGPTEALTYKIPFMLDAFDENNNPQDREASPGHSVIDQQRREIEQLSGTVHHNPPVEPPTLILNAHGTIPHDDTHEPGKHRWVISEPPEWGEWIRNEAGLLLRQEGVLTFKKHEADLEFERTRKLSQPRRLHASGRDSYEEIAKNQLKHASWGTKLARLQRSPQPHQNARQTPKRGTIVGPSILQENEWKRGK